VVEWLSAHPRMRAALLVVIGLVIGMVVFGFVVVGVDRASSDTARDAHGSPPRAGSPSTEVDGPAPREPVSAAQPPPPAAAAAEERPVSALPALPDTDDPDVYAAAVAEVLFGMDYANHTPDDYEALFDAALWDQIVEPDRARIRTIISRRIPTADMWAQMRLIEQASEFEVELVWEPRTGRDHREAGDWPGGVVLRNVSGTQTETWQAPGEDRASSSRPVAVTVAVVCPPASSPCRLGGIHPGVGS
jgi:hypothetical protein